MAKTRRELDLTRNTIRRLESIQGKLLTASAQWGDADNFIASELERKADEMEEIISEIRKSKTA